MSALPDIARCRYHRGYNIKDLGPTCFVSGNKASPVFFWFIDQPPSLPSMGLACPLSAFRAAPFSRDRKGGCGKFLLCGRALCFWIFNIFNFIIAHFEQLMSRHPPTPSHPLCRPVAYGQWEAAFPWIHHIPFHLSLTTACFPLTQRFQTEGTPNALLWAAQSHAKGGLGAPPPPRLLPSAKPATQQRSTTAHRHLQLTITAPDHFANRLGFCAAAAHARFLRPIPIPIPIPNTFLYGGRQMHMAQGKDSMAT